MTINMQEIRRSQQKIKSLSQASSPVKYLEPKIKKTSYYKILESSKLPIISKTNRSAVIINHSPEQTVERIVKNHQYVYIDMNEQSGCKPMQRYQNNPNEKKMNASMTTSSYLDDQLEKIGNSYISQLKNLSLENQQAYQYFQKTKQMTEQRDQIRKLVRSQLDQSLKKVNLRKSYKVDYNSLRPKKLELHDPQKLRKILEKEQLQTINHEIWKKQKKLIDKFGIAQNYLPYNKTHKGIEKTIKMRKYKSKLPQLDYRTIQ